MAIAYLVEGLSADAAASGQTLTLDRDQSHHLCRVLRLRSDDTFEAMNGCGSAFACTLVKSDKSAAEVRVDHVTREQPKPGHRTTLVAALVKGQGMDRLLASAVELGATDIALLISERVNLRLDEERSANKLTHWRKVIANAAEQCGQLWLPVLHEPINGVVSLLAATTQGEPHLDGLIAMQPGETPFPGQLALENCAVAMGPEGGWSEAELKAFTQQGVPLHQLTDLVLRAETVPAVALAMLSQARAAKA